MSEENTSYEFKLRILNIDIFSVSVNAKASSNKVIAAGTAFAAITLLLIGAYSDKILSAIKFLIT